MFGKISFFTVILGFFALIPVLKVFALTPQSAGHFGSDTYSGASSSLVDTAGNRYIIGLVRGTTDFDPSSSTTSNETVTGLNGYINILDSSGNFDSTMTFGEDAVNHSINNSFLYNDIIYVAGYYTGTSVQFFSSTAPTSTSTNPVAYIMAVDPDTASLEWIRYIETGSEGATSAEINMHDIEVNATGVYVSGEVRANSGSEEIDLDSTAGFDIFTPGSELTGFVSKYQLNGTYVDSLVFGNTTGRSKARGIAIDASGSMYVSGDFTAEVDFAPGVAGGSLTPATTADSFLVALNDDFTYYWGTLISADEFVTTDQGLDLVSDTLIVAGTFEGVLSPDDANGATTIDTIGSGDADAFMAAYDLDGDYKWAHAVGGSDYDESYGFGVSADGSAYLGALIYTVLGETVDLDPTSGTENYTFSGSDFIDEYAQVVVQFDVATGAYIDSMLSNTEASLFPEDITAIDSDTIIVVGGLNPVGTNVDVNFGPANSAPGFTVANDVTTAYYLFTEFVAVATPTPTPTATPTPTPSPDSSDSSGSSSNGGGSNTATAKQCDNSRQISAPDVFQMRVLNNKVEISLAPVSGADQYVFEYKNLFGGHYGATFESRSDTGVQTFSIAELSSDTEYVIRARGGRGCQTGDWSAFIPVRTLASAGQSSLVYRVNDWKFSGGQQLSTQLKSGRVSQAISGSVESVEEVTPVQKLNAPSVPALDESDSSEPDEIEPAQSSESLSWFDRVRSWFSDR